MVVVARLSTPKSMTEHISPKFCNLWLRAFRLKWWKCEAAHSLWVPLLLLNRGVMTAPHKVTVDDYYIAKTTVTQGFWRAIMGTTLTDFASQLGVCTYGVGDDYPMYFISWDDCEEFIGKLNEITQMNFRLPTEAEWEFACRGGKNSKKYKYSGSNDIDEVAWYSDNSNASTQPVATKAPNELGIYDMSGNVWEWCSDWYGFYSRDSQDSPTGPASGDDRVMRGGGFSSYADETLLHTRNYGNPAKCYNNFGFRLALTYSGKRPKR